MSGKALQLTKFQTQEEGLAVLRNMYRVAKRQQTAPEDGGYSGGAVRVGMG